MTPLTCKTCRKWATLCASYRTGDTPGCADYDPTAPVTVVRIGRSWEIREDGRAVAMCLTIGDVYQLCNAQGWTVQEILP